MAKDTVQRRNSSEIAPPKGVRGASGSVFRLDGIQVDAPGGRLTRDGREEYLRHKTWEVLVILLQNRHRIVTKEELVDRVWGDLVVDDDALVQCVVDIRKALGDDSRSPRYVRTVPKVGYRFIGEVEESPAAPAAAKLVVEEVTSVEVEMEVREEYTEVPDPEPRALPPAGLLPSRRAVRWGLMATALAALAVLGILVFYGQKWQVSTTLANVPGKKPLAVLLFENQSKSPDLAWLHEGLTDMLIADLSASGRLNVLSRQQLQLLLERVGARSEDPLALERAVEVARRSGAEAFVLGSYTRLGGSLRISVQLHDGQSGTLLAAESATAERPELIFGQIDRLAGRLLADLQGGTPAGTPLPGLAAAMTGNLEAYRLYSLALDKLQGLHNQEAIELLEKAVTLDPGFAMAHARIGYAYVVWSFPERGRPHLERAFRLSERLTEKDRLHIAAWDAIARLDFPAAIRFFERLVREHPMEVEAYLRLAALLTGERRNEEALAVARRGLEVDPENGDLYNVLSSAHRDLGRQEDSLSAAKRYVALCPDEPNAQDTLGLVHQQAGRYEEAIAAYREALRLKPDFEVAVIHLGNTYFCMGRYRDAAEEYRRYVGIGPSEAERQRGHSSLGFVRLKRGELAEAERENALANGPDWLSFLIALEKRDLGSARSIAQRLSADVGGNGRGRRASQRPRLSYEGMLALESGDATTAIDRFQQALRQEPVVWNIEQFEDGLANAYLSLKRFDEAVTEYQRVLRFNPNYPLARYRLARAYEGLGDAARAREEYRRFLETWKGADPDLVEVRDAKRRLS